MVLPGFIETHNHPPGTADADLFSISLFEVMSDLDAMLEVIKDFVAAIRIWICTTEPGSRPALSAARMFLSAPGKRSRRSLPGQTALPDLL
jgi:hypothetical protein